MKTLFLILTFQVLLLAQYTKNDYDLVKTTFRRAFDKKILNDYLGSGNDEKINAALLSISHSEDTSLIPAVTSLNFEKHAKYICFALGQIGKSKKSAKFIWDKIHSDSFGKNSRFLFNALGKAGSKEDLTKLIALYSNFDGPSYPFSGISLAVYQFARRNIKSDKAKQILIDEVNNPFTPAISKNDALFALARSGSSAKINDELIRILLKPTSGKTEDIAMKQFALLNFKAQKYFPANEQLFNNLINEGNPLLRIEAAKILPFYNFTSKEELKNYTDFLKDSNSNVAITTAASIKYLKINENLKETLYTSLSEFLRDKTQNENVRGELFLSFTKIFPAADVQPFLKNIPKDYYYNYLSRENHSEKNLNEILNAYDNASRLAEKINLLTNLLSFEMNFPQNKKLNDLLLNAVNSNEAPLVSIASDGVDSSLIHHNKSVLTEIIEHKTSAEKNNPDFIEGIMSLLNLSERIDSLFYQKIVNEVSSSQLYSLRKFISHKNKRLIVGERELNNFEELWDEAFKYSSAIIKTEKGSFTIKFKPEFAPISVGNFCRLSNDNFFDGIVFHRVVPGFVIQGGDPSASGWGGPGYEIISEFSPLPYNIGMVGMASAGKDTEGSQWFVMQGNYPHLNGRYTIFAEVTDGMNTVYSIEQKDKIVSVTLIP